MYIHDLNPILINFGFFEVRWYSLAYIVGILTGWWLAKKIIIFKVKDQNAFFDYLYNYFNSTWWQDWICSFL